MTRVLLLLIGLLLVAAPATADPDEPHLERLEASLAQHPDDADLHWLLAESLLDAGDAVRAAQLFDAYGARWPGRREDLALWRGRALYEAGRYSEAERALIDAIARHPGDAAARLLHGLALRRLERFAEAERELRFAAEIEPELVAETLVLRGLTLLDQGRESAAAPLFRQAIAEDPGSDAARRAERLLGRPPVPPTERNVELAAFGGFEWDSNVTLESGTDLPGASSTRRDGRLLLGGAVSWRALRSERAGLVLGYRFDQTRHDTLAELDLQSHVAHAAGTLALGEHSALRLDGYGVSTHLDSDRYLRTAGLRPNFFLALGPRWGVLRLHAEAERRSYHEQSSLSSLDRSGFVLGMGAEHYLGRLESSWGSYSARYARTDTDAERDLFGFGPAFDHGLFEGRVRLHAPLFWEITADLQLGLSFERYDHRNVIDFLTDDGVGTLAPNRRRDIVVEGRIALARPLTRATDLELAWRRVERHSNVDVYGYDRDVLGLYLNLHSF